LSAAVRARWSSAEVPATADSLSRAGYARPLAVLLAQRGIDGPEAAARFLAPRREDLVASSELAGLSAAAQRLANARRAGERVLVVGDYDVDGVAATAIVAAALRSAGVEVETLLPRRDAEGYGLQALHVERAAELGAAVLVAVDSGTNAVEATREAQRQRIDLIVLDHHLPEGVASGDRILVNPRSSLHLPAARDLTASGLALRLAAEVLARLERAVPWDALLRVACLGTIADVAPLVGDNRIIAALGLATLADSRSPGLRALLETADLRGGPVSAADVAFRLAPRLNAAGRLETADAALELLLARDVARAREIARRLERLNSERQGIERRIVDEARRVATSTGNPPPLIVEWSATWHRGVVGVAAAKLARELHRPTILLAVDGETATGSGRSVAGIALHEFLRPWSGELERFGGHAQAIGLTAALPRLASLRSRWQTAASAWSARLQRRERVYSLAVPPHDIDGALLEALESLAPFGAGNEEPLFRVGPCRLRGAPRRFGNGHLGFELVETSTAGGLGLEAIVWRAEERGLDPPADDFELLGAVERDRRGRVRLRVEDLRPASGEGSD